MAHQMSGWSNGWMSSQPVWGEMAGEMAGEGQAKGTGGCDGTDQVVGPAPGLSCWLHPIPVI